MTSTDFIHKAKEAVARVSVYTASEPQPVWFGYVLGNMKTILCIPGAEHVEMYEVTYNRSKGEIYVDLYVNTYNTVFNTDKI